MATYSSNLAWKISPWGSQRVGPDRSTSPSPSNQWQLDAMRRWLIGCSLMQMVFLLLAALAPQDTTTCRSSFNRVPFIWQNCSCHWRRKLNNVYAIKQGLSRGPQILASMLDDLRWSWHKNNRNKVYNKCNELESSPNHPPTQPLARGKIVSQETGSGCPRSWAISFLLPY